MSEALERLRAIREIVTADRLLRAIVEPAGNIPLALALAEVVAGLKSEHAILLAQAALSEGKMMEKGT